jgi:hypothetical protein
MAAGLILIYGGGGNNPCGAYYPNGGPLSNSLIVDGCWTQNGQVNHNTFSTLQQDNPTNTTRGKGICCDLFDRVGANGPVWEFNTSYSMFDTVVATGDKCGGCFYHNYNPTNTGNPYNISGINWNKRRPCESVQRQTNGFGFNPSFEDGFGVTSYIENWSSCKLLLDRGLPGPCTMHNSFGLIFDDTVNINHPGSPNGSCTENCMQLNANYFEQRVAGQNLDYAQYPPNNYNPETAYDTEASTQDFQGNTGPTGPKLIWAGFAPNQWDPDDSLPSETDILQAVGSPAPFGVTTFAEIHPIGTNPVPGINTSTPIFWDPTGGNNPATYQYPFIDVIDGVTYQGYLPQGASVDNSWGLLSPALGGTPPQPESKLWARKSVWRIQPPNGPTPSTSTNDAFANCTYVSFGCTDPTFGNYNPYAELDCAGYPKNNVWIPDENGNPTPCLNINGGVVDYCWDPATGLRCNDCIDPNTGDYNITLPTCTPEIYNACGGDGYLTADAWGTMILSRPESWLYGGGAASLGLIGFGDGFARFWDKDGNDRTQIQEFIDNNLNASTLDRPLCQCNNSGCMLPTASNYSPLNTTDCSNEPAGGGVGFFGQYGDVTCCVFEKFGCPDNTYVVPPQNNYFCSVDLNGDGTPDNLEFCMDPATGIPCVNPINGDVNPTCLQGPVPGANTDPLSSGGGNYNNPTVNLTDDGSCELILIPGCKDDGGPLAGGNFPASLYPGYSAVNFDPTATVHVQILCEYVFGCPDQLAQNVINDLPVCGNVTLQSKANEINLNNPGLPPITASFVENNLIPNIECCDYNIPGTGPGCTDPNALNYNPLADTDDGSCIYSIEGCTDPNALNFNPSATLDDSSCLYPGDYPSEGDNFLDGTPIEICREPLTKEEVLMNVCQPTEIQSEVFIERGKQSVFEPNQRLDEVKTIGGLKIYGYGFYNIKEQI